MRKKNTARALLIAALLAVAWPTGAAAQITATARPGATPPWDKGLQPMTPESYYHAIECGKQESGDPPCVFWDTGLCQNDDFTLSAYSAYKQVAYEVWATVQQGQPAPEPNFYAAQRTRVTINAVPAPGSDAVLTDLILTRGGEAVSPVDRNIRAGRVTWDYEAWAPTTAVTLDMVSETRTISCVIEPAVLRQFR